MGGALPAALRALGLGPDAPAEDIRRAYRRLVMRYHPDSSNDPDSARRFLKVLRAYKILRENGAPCAAPSAPAPAESPRDRYRRALDAQEDLFDLGRVLAQDPDPVARQEALRRLGFSGKAAAFIFVRRALYDANEAVAMAAIRALLALGSRQAAGEVAALYSRAPASLRRSMLELARDTGEKLFSATLKAAVEDTDPFLRSLARGIRL